jgi:hypothetical protein
VSVIEPSDAVTQEWLNRSRDVDWRFGASLCHPLALWLVGPVILLVHTTYEDGTDRMF